jgi:DNA-binding transcriptional ArsR family regulator
MATTREELMELVRDLDEKGAADVLDYVRWLLSEEDAPLRDEERAEVERAEAEIARGDYVTLEELERRLGL